MHRIVRRLATARCSTTTTTKNAARLLPHTRCSAVARLPAAPTILSRRIHVRVPLPYEVEHGMGDFLPPAALKLIAEDYQQGLLDRLNEQIKGAHPSLSILLGPRTLDLGTNLENMSVAQIVISTAPHESQTLAFNYASLALNNSFFLHHLVGSTLINERTPLEKNYFRNPLRQVMDPRTTNPH
jgi:hypothetical protein